MSQLYVVVAVETKFDHGALSFSLGRHHRVSFPRGKRLLELIYVSLLQNARKGSFFETKIKLLMYLKVVLLQKRREVKIVCDFVFPNFRKMVGNPDHTKPKFANINISLRLGYFEAPVRVLRCPIFLEYNRFSLIVQWFIVFYIKGLV